MAAGIVIGSFQLFIGILLAMLGVAVDYDVDASVGPAKLKLASASPGLLLVICGNLLIGFSLMRELEFSQSTQELPQDDQQAQDGPLEGVTPLGTQGP